LPSIGRPIRLIVVAAEEAQRTDGAVEREANIPAAEVFKELGCPPVPQRETTLLV
jgi:hypothetical protein